MADVIRTVTGVMMTPLNATKDDIVLEDIAHSLSFLCRANGHYRKFYSVGAHSINCYEEAANRQESKRIQLAALLHDATEAYMSDITRPVKKSIPDYSIYEAKLSDVIYEKFLGSTLTQTEAAIVKQIDDAMLYHEFYEFTAYKLFDEAPYVAGTPNFFQGPPEMVEENFTKICEKLMKEIEEEKNKVDDKPKIKLDLGRLYC